MLRQLLYSSDSDDVLNAEYTYCFLIRIDSLPADWHSVWGWQRITAGNTSQFRVRWSLSHRGYSVWRTV